MKKTPVAAILLCACLIAGCGRNAGQKTIGVSLLTKEHVFYRDMEKALRDTAAKHNFNLIVNSGDWDLAKHQAPPVAAPAPGPGAAPGTATPPAATTTPAPVDTAPAPPDTTRR